MSHPPESLAAECARLRARVAFLEREKEKTVQLLRQWDVFKTRLARRDKIIADLRAELDAAIPTPS